MIEESVAAVLALSVEEATALLKEFPPRRNQSDDQRVAHAVEAWYGEPGLQDRVKRGAAGGGVQNGGAQQNDPVVGGSNVGPPLSFVELGKNFVEEPDLFDKDKGTLDDMEGIDEGGIEKKIFDEDDPGMMIIEEKEIFGGEKVALGERSDRVRDMLGIQSAKRSGEHGADDVEDAKRPKKERDDKVGKRKFFSSPWS